METVAIEPAAIRVQGRPVKVFEAMVKARVDGDTLIIEDEPVVTDATLETTDKRKAKRKARRVTATR